MNSRVLFISYDGLTDPLGQSQILPYLVGLSKLGYRFTILSFEKKERYEREQAQIRSICASAQINWEPEMFTSRPPVLSKMYDRWKMKRAVQRLHRKYQFQMLHCRSYISAEMGLWMKRKYGTLFFFDMRGFWADEKVDGGQWNLSNPLFKRIYKHYKKRERQFLQEADAIVSLTEAARQDMLKRPGFEQLAVDVIPCCADLHLFDYNKVDQDEVQAAASEMGISSTDRVISYLGSVGGWYMTNEMFEFFKELHNRYSDFVMLVLSKDDPERIRADAAAAGLPPEALRIRFAGRKELPAFLALSHCSIFFIRPTYSKMASSPTKHAELMGMGIPVVCNDIGDTGRILEDTRTGVVIREFTHEAYGHVIDQFPSLLEIEPAYIRRQAFTYFDLQAGIDRYLQIYKKLMPENGDA